MVAIIVLLQVGSFVLGAIWYGHRDREYVLATLAKYDAQWKAKFEERERQWVELMRVELAKVAKACGLRLVPTDSRVTG